MTSPSGWEAKNRRAMYNMLPDVMNWTAAFKLSQEEARDITVSQGNAGPLPSFLDPLGGPDA